MMANCYDIGRILAALGIAGVFLNGPMLMIASVAA